MATLASPPSDAGRIHTSDRTRGYKQDLPPRGGYEPINFKRVPARQIVNGKMLLGLGLTWQVANFAIVYWYRQRKERAELEVNSADMALMPMLTAERDREFLKQLRRNRDYEADLMSDVPGWVVGTWFGQEVFKKTDDKLMTPTADEFYISAPLYNARKEKREPHWAFY